MPPPGLTAPLRDLGYLRSRSLSPATHSGPLRSAVVTYMAVTGGVWMWGKEGGGKLIKNIRTFVVEEK